MKVETMGDTLRLLLVAAFLFFTLPQFLSPPARAALQETATVIPRATAEDLIRLTNQVRVRNGLKPLTVNSILMATAQWTADYMADNDFNGHIGGVRERVMAAGYGGGEAAWATENIMVGNLSAEEVVLQAWADDIHSIPAANPIYCDVGAGVAVSAEGEVYYVLHAAYSSHRTCGPYISPDGTTLPGLATPSAETGTPQAWSMAELIVPVRTATPQADGSVVHTVQQGQSLWSIAIAYGVKIKDLLAFNRLPPDQQTIFPGQKLKIPVTVSATAAPTATARSLAQLASPDLRSPAPTRLDALSATPQPTPDSSSSYTRQIIRTAIFAALGLGVLLIVAGVILGKSR